MKGLTRQIIVAASGLFMIFVLSFTNTKFTDSGNSFSDDFGGAGPERGAETFYDIFPTAISPAPFTFAIWGPIFLGAIALIIYQALPKNRADRRLDALGWPLIAAYMSNAVIGFTPPGISVLVILTTLASLILAFRALAKANREEGRGFTWLVRVPTELFFGWITLATLLAVSQWLVSLGWNGLGIPESVWGAGLILIALAIAVVMVRKFRAYAYSAALLWGFIGIFVVRPNTMLIQISVAVALATLIWVYFNTWRSKQPRLVSA